LNRDDTVEIVVSKVRNPVSLTNVASFAIETQDSEGFSIDKSNKNLKLLSAVMKPNTFKHIKVSMLGDTNGEHEGMIVTLQTF
jgi:hypothetical protein